jgi:hypothetical protein
MKIDFKARIAITATAGAMCGQTEMMSIATLLRPFVMRETQETSVMRGRTEIPLGSCWSFPGLKDGRVDALAMWETESENAIPALGKDAIVLQYKSGRQREPIVPSFHPGAIVNPSNLERPSAALVLPVFQYIAKTLRE